MNVTELEKLAQRLSNWGRWGADDEAGTLNHITPDVVAAAARSVEHGHVEQLGIPLDTAGPQVDSRLRFNPRHRMTALPAEFVRADGTGIADDVLELPLQAGTQWDALAHIAYRGLLYGGRPATVVTADGAPVNAITAAADRVVSRGVLADIARHRGVDVLDSARPITRAELTEALDASGVRVRRGDVLLVRTGHLGACRERGWAGFSGPSPGLGIDTLAWIHESEIAAVASDTSFVEVRPSTVAGIRAPFHVVAIVYLGLLLGEMFDLDGLGAACARLRRWEFLFVAPPLRVTGAVGSPINPYAIL
ncbi:cyclase family protein [Actinoplanes sp. NPDC051411]|jgi:kynurenine formamidase|uniref:cyclase family protein n=1 Tax=Actinoplanes sp. NPDC051411 TaxID=3155522 RepID=UPI00343C30A7